MSAIIDVQGFKTDGNQFILKEMAMQCGSQILVLLFKPPFPYYNLSKTERRQVGWIEKNRGLYWNEGFIPYKDHKHIIQNVLRNKICIFTKGMEKVTWIKEMLGELCNNRICNLEDNNTPSFSNLYKEYDELMEDVYSCACHNNICALKNVLTLRKWCNQNKIY